MTTRLVPHPNAALPALPPPALLVDLRHHERRRRYWIRPGRATGRWFMQVFYDDMQHRGYDGTYADAERCFAEFTREIHSALVDGWTLQPR